MKNKNVLEKEIREIEKQQEDLERMARKLRNEEEKRFYEDDFSIKVLNSSRESWLHDSRLKEVHEEQLQIMTHIQRIRGDFLENWGKEKNKLARELADKKEECQLEISRLQRREKLLKEQEDREEKRG